MRSKRKTTTTKFKTTNTTTPTNSNTYFTTNFKTNTTTNIDTNATTATTITSIMIGNLIISEKFLFQHIVPTT
ncbi:unnamed protein product [Nesidiocoris tenuis]|uniref:Uncharacterized protein n=1 Tax=Nesidiocoris tenuis TaxID=355587 RepID=A0A6H5HA57_9HEMI|nr:unnamed protein product [Nesidiocoris tenuis]